MGIPSSRVEFVISYVKNILVHGSLQSETMAKVFEGGKNN